MTTSFLQRIKQRARKQPKRILFPEWFEERVLKALPEILKEGTAQPILLGVRKDVEKKAKEIGILIDWKKISIIDLENNPVHESFMNRYKKLMGDRMTDAQAKKDIETNINVFGSLMVEGGLVDGMISGVTCSTSETIRPAIRLIGTKEKFHKVSGFFFMIVPEGEKERVLLFADCAVIPEPSSHELADIAIDTAETAKRFGIEPRIAMLSFSTNGSAKHPFADKVREAAKMVKDRRPDLICEGEMQVDAALVPEICRRKFPSAKVCEGFNVLIFPSLESGNIAYKLVERLGRAHAIGPIYQGLRKPVNDLSRGCSVQDIVDLAAFTSVEAQGEEQILNQN